MSVLTASHANITVKISVLILSHTWTTVMSVLTLSHAWTIVMSVLTLSQAWTIVMSVMTVSHTYTSHNVCVDTVTCLNNCHVCDDTDTCLNSSHVCVDIVTCLHHCHSVKLHAWLSSTFLQILPELARPLRGTAISPQLSIDTVSTLPKVWNLIRLSKQHSVQACP